MSYSEFSHQQLLQLLELRHQCVDAVGKPNHWLPEVLTKLNDIMPFTAVCAAHGDLFSSASSGADQEYDHFSFTYSKGSTSWLRHFIEQGLAPYDPNLRALGAGNKRVVCQSQEVNIKSQGELDFRNSMGEFGLGDEMTGIDFSDQGQTSTTLSLFFDSAVQEAGYIKLLDSIMPHIHHAAMRTNIAVDLHGIVLTHYEKEVLQRCANWSNFSEIAHKLKMTEIGLARTIRGICEKFSVKSMPQAVAKALHLKLFEV